MTNINCAAIIQNKEHKNKFPIEIRKKSSMYLAYVFLVESSCCHTYKVNIHSNLDAHQKPNTNKETKILNQRSNKKAKDTIQYWFSLLFMMIAKLPQKKKNHPNFQTKTKAKAKINYNQNTFIETIFNANTSIKTL